MGRCTLSQAGQDAIPEGFEPLRELRRTYHDRIAGIREQSVVLIRAAVESAAAATRLLRTGGVTGTSETFAVKPGMHDVVAAVDQEVLSLLALESPVARDLRVILAARDVTHLGLLCMGLTEALTVRSRRAAEVLPSELQTLVGEVGEGTLGMLGDAETAWAGLDPATAGRVAPAGADVRARQTDLVAALIALEGIPMEAALDLAMVARAYERLADHAEEIAERVIFAVEGTTAPLSEP